MLYTRRGDDGTTKTFGCNQRISKSSSVAEALGTLDEANSFLGICKVRAKEAGLVLPGSIECYEAVHGVQKNLFIVQAELAGSKMSIAEEKVKEIETMIDSIEKELPPIKTFFISGGTELGATFDFARTLARRAERRVVAAAEDSNLEIGQFTRSYLNRLSSLLYAFARFANHSAGIAEEGPDYK